jgi:uncharacterized protein (TIGR03067 family)
MRRQTRCAAAAALTLVLAAAAAGQGGDAKADRDRLQGSWELQGTTLNGKPAPTAPGPVVLTIAGDKITTRAGDKVTREGTFTLDTSKKPRQLVARAKKGDKEEVDYLIYEFDGDTLRLALTLPGKEAPAGFGGENVMVATFKRAKK